MTHLTILLTVALLGMGAPPTVTTHVVGELDGRPLTLELIVPEGDGPHPVIAWIHGGAWWGGNHLQMPGFTRAALDSGFAVASLDYRLTSEAGVWGREHGTWPAQLHDCKAGIRWLRANAERHRLDPDRIAAWGASAGGHLSAMVGLTADAPELEGDVGPHRDVSSRVAVAVDFYGPSELLTMNEDVTTPPGSVIDHDALDSPESRLLGSGVHQRSLAEIKRHRDDPTGPWPELIERARSASLVHQVSGSDRTPLYIAHGARDRLVPVRQSKRLVAACREHDVPHRCVWYEEAGHGFPPPVWRDALDWLVTAMPARTR